MEALDADEIEYIEGNAWHIEIGIQLLNGYLKELAERAIATEDFFLIDWCKDLMIITEAEEGGENYVGERKADA